MADIIAYKQVALDEENETELVQYVAASKAQHAKQILQEEGYVVTEEPLTELPDGVSLDITDEVPANAADILE